jgi:hypothetical protein
VWPTGGVQAENEPISLQGLSAIYMPKNCEEAFSIFGGSIENLTLNYASSSLGNSYVALSQSSFVPNTIPFLEEVVRKEELARQLAERDLANKLAAEARAAANKLAAAAKKTTITCVKGKLTKKVTAVKPKCPSGYKVKK